MYLALFQCNYREMLYNNIMIIMYTYVGDNALSLLFCSLITRFALLMYVLCFCAFHMVIYFVINIVCCINIINNFSFHAAMNIYGTNCFHFLSNTEFCSLYLFCITITIMCYNTETYLRIRPTYYVCTNLHPAVDK